MWGYIFRLKNDFRTIIVDIRARGLIMENPIDFGQDLAPMNELLENSATGVLPDLNSEAWESFISVES